jgi:hypothetical protein
VHPVLFSPLQSEFMEPLSETMDNQEQTPKRLKQGVLVLLLASFFLNAFPHVNAIKDIFFVLALIGFLVLVVKKGFAPASLPRFLSRSYCYWSGLLSPQCLPMKKATVLTVSSRICSST